MVYSFNQSGSSSSEYWPDKSLHIFLCGMCNFFKFRFSQYACLCEWFFAETVTNDVSNFKAHKYVDTFPGNLLRFHMW